MLTVRRDASAWMTWRRDPVVRAPE